MLSSILLCGTISSFIAPDPFGKKFALSGQLSVNGPEVYLMEYASAEQYVQYHKAWLFKDYEIAEKFKIYFNYDNGQIRFPDIDPERKTDAVKLAGMCRDLGQEVRNFKDAVWQEHVRKFAYDALYRKF